MKFNPMNEYKFKKIQASYYVGAMYGDKLKRGLILRLG